MNPINYQEEIDKIIADSPRLRAVQWALNLKLAKCQDPYQKCLIIMEQVTKDLKKQLEAYNELVNIIQESPNQPIKRSEIIPITQSKGKKDGTVSPPSN